MPSLVTKVGVIGGSGLYQMDGLENVVVHDVVTPFGPPSDVVVSGKWSGKEVFFLPRHGRGHRLLPSEVNSRANVWALRSLGVTHVIAVSAVGSLRQDFRPGDVVIPNSILDRTTGIRARTFFGQGIVGHVGFADPFCPELRGILLSVGRRVAQALSANAGAGTAGAGVHAPVSVHDGGAYVCIEGPRFSTRAESRQYRQMGASVIGMTAMPEAVLVREAEMAYGALNFVTDYDCWKDDEQAVSVDVVLSVLKRNSQTARAILSEVIAALPSVSENPLFEAARDAFMSDLSAAPAETKKALEVLYGKYWNSESSL